jgi:putative flippase GtrA
LASFELDLGRIVNRPFARFVFVGGAAAATNIVSRVLLSEIVSFSSAVVLAFPVALTFAFLMSRRFVFDGAEGSALNQYFRFFLVNLAALGQVWLISVGLAEWLLPAIGWTHHPELVAHTIAVGSPVVTSYYAHKVFTFG